MLQQKTSLIEERRRAAMQTRLQKESIAKMMEEVRTNASLANKLITQAMTGKVQLEALVPSATKGKKKARSKSAGKERKKKTSADKLGLGRTSVSAGDYDAEFEKYVDENPSVKYATTDRNEAGSPKPFISPYEEKLVD